MKILRNPSIFKNLQKLGNPENSENPDNLENPANTENSENPEFLENVEIPDNLKIPLDIWFYLMDLFEGLEYYIFPSGREVSNTLEVSNLKLFLVAVNFTNLREI